MLIYSFITDYQAFNLRYKDNTTRDKNETKVDKQSANLGKNNEPIQNRLSFLIDCKSVILHHLAILSFPMVRPAWDNWWVVIMYIQVVVLYVLSFIVLYTLRKNILTCIDKVMYRFVFWIIYVSTIFYFLNIENNDIFLRWLNVVKIPMIYLLSKYVFNRFTYSCISMTNCFVLFLLFAFWFSTNIYIIGVSHINVK